MRSLPLLIIGGGPAGSAAAIALAREGLAPELIERSEGPRDVVCGGFLGWDALAALRRLGVEPPALGARPIHRLRLAARERSVEARLPRPAAGLSRRRLDEALLEAAAAAGACVRRGIAAKSAEGRLVRLSDGEQIAADALFLATGKHELRGLARVMPKSRGEGALGLRTSFAPDAALAAALEGVIELHPFNGGYAGLLLQEDGQVNLCLSVAAARLRQAGSIPALLERLGREAPQFRARLAAAGERDWLSISNVPYGWRARPGGAAIHRLGDQAAVIASLAGDGIAIALTSGLAAAHAYLEGESARTFQKRFSARAGRPLRAAQLLRWAAERRLPRRLLVGAAGLAPPLTRLAARLTRIG